MIVVHQNELGSMAELICMRVVCSKSLLSDSLLPWCANTSRLRPSCAQAANLGDARGLEMRSYQRICMCVQGAPRQLHPSAACQVAHELLCCCTLHQWRARARALMRRSSARQRAQAVERAVIGVVRARARSLARAAHLRQ